MITKDYCTARLRQVSSSKNDVDTAWRYDEDSKTGAGDGKPNRRVNWKEVVRRNCYPILMLYCFDIPEGKYLLLVKQGTDVKGLYVG